MLKEVNQDVFYSNERIVKVDKSVTEFLINHADFSERKRSRLCSHLSPKDKVHEMIIVHNKGAYVRPHKHKNRTESFHVIIGSADVLIFDDKGKVKETIHLSPYPGTFFLRINKEDYHGLIIRSNVFMFHETTSGPFNKKDTIFPSWAKEESI